MINKDLKIYIAGHNGMVGSACWRMLKNNAYSNLIGKSSKELDLRNQESVEIFFKKHKPDIVIDAAARVGGIWANNNYKYEFLLDNLLIQNNLIKCAHENDVKKFIFLGSSCIYPKFSQQPIKEEYLLNGPLEETNQWYAIAKISGIKLIEAIRKQFNKDFVSFMPTNLYGPGDNYNLKTSHVLPALIRKFHEAKINNLKEVTLWGTGRAIREFLHVDDLASAVLFSFDKKLEFSMYNVGSGDEITIENLAILIKNIIGFKGKIYFDKSMPDGTPRKTLDTTKINELGWMKKISLEKGIKNTYKSFLEC